VNPVNCEYETSNVNYVTVGSDKDVEKIKKSFELGCAILSQDEEHPLVQSEAVTCFQRLHLFGTINFNLVIPVLFRSIKSTSLALRRTAVDCFRQLSQRDAQVVCQHFSKLCEKLDCLYAEYGISGMLFLMLDKESDQVLRKGIMDTLSSVMSGSIHDAERLQSSIALCKSILTAGDLIYYLFLILKVPNFLNACILLVLCRLRSCRRYYDRRFERRS